MDIKKQSEKIQKELDALVKTRGQVQASLREMNTRVERLVGKLELLREMKEED